MRSKKYERIVINISGEIFETFEKTLKRFPDTLLGKMYKRRPYYCLKSNQYFFNRSRQCFGAILFFYQSNGILTCPPSIDMDIFEIECHFFEIPDAMINEMKKKAGIIPELKDKQQDDNQSRTYLTRLWDFLENPETSVPACVFAIFSLTVILLSLLCACLETVSFLKRTEKLEEIPWSILEMMFNFWFLVELVARFMVSPAKDKFLKSSLNWIDAFAVFPYFVILLIESDKATSLGFLRCLRYIRVIRFFRLSKHSKRLKVVGEIIKLSFGDFQLLILCLSMLIILGGSLLYYVEGQLSPTSNFSNIPNSLWWAMQTITTVGYGDIVPMTSVGKFLSACLMTFGVVTITLPVLSIVTRFISLYAKNIDGNMLIV